MSVINTGTWFNINNSPSPHQLETIPSFTITIISNTQTITICINLQLRIYQVIKFVNSPTSTLDPIMTHGLLNNPILDFRPIICILPSNQSNKLLHLRLLSMMQNKWFTKFSMAILFKDYHWSMKYFFIIKPGAY